MNLPKYFKPIENCYIKIHHVCSNGSNLLFKVLRHWKIDFFQLRCFLNSILMNIFLAIKDYSFPVCCV